MTGDELLHMYVHQCDLGSRFPPLPTSYLHC